ncbi:MAG: carbon-nitrogen hydrolase family protein [Thermotogota bacterium]
METRIAVAQSALGSDKKRNLKGAVGLIERAAAGGARVVCFPDYFLTGVPTSDDVGKLPRIAELVPDGPSVRALAAAAAEHEIYVIAGTLVESGDDGKLYSTCAFLGPDGSLVGKIRKSHPENAPAKHELGCGIVPADPEYRVFDTEFGKVGIMLDMEGIAVEVPRILEVKGAEIIFWPLNFSARFPGVGVEVACYSGFTHAYVAAACGVGWAKGVPVHPEAFYGEPRADLFYPGGSAIAFCGEIIARAPSFSEGVAYAMVDPARVQAVRASRRKHIPLERRPETYVDLVKSMARP